VRKRTESPERGISDEPDSSVASHHSFRSGAKATALELKEKRARTLSYVQRHRIRKACIQFLRQIKLARKKAHGRQYRKQVLEPTPKTDGIRVSEKELVRANCKESFFEFVQEFWSTVIPEKPVWNWHIRMLCEQVQFMMERVFLGLPKLYDLVVNIPPGTSKSSILSVMLPVWCWIRMPSFRSICASYAETLALDLSLKSRDIVESDKFRECFPEIVLRSDQNVKSHFRNTAGGFRYAVGVNGSVTGFHAHNLIVDDPIDPLKSRSLADMKTANYWLDRQLSNRKVDKKVSVMILVMQRLHQDDPTNLFLRRKKVFHICLPAEVTPDVRPTEFRKNYVNGLLDPVRMDRGALSEEKQKGEDYYSSQFLQSPIPAEGAKFKTDRIKKGVPPDSYSTLVRFWDKAGTQEGSGAFTVGTLLGLDWTGRFWVLDVVRGRWDSYEREKVIRKTADRDGFKVVVGVEQEPGSGGKESAENTLTRTLRGYRCKAVKVDKSTGGKEERADPWSVQVNGGNVYLPERLWDPERNCWSEQDWAAEWVEEHRYFPHGRWKDQVDSAALAFSMCNKPRVRVGGINPHVQQPEYGLMNYR
jgi:predicted phage terminase large subunit-like protein